MTFFPLETNTSSFRTVKNKIVFKNGGARPLPSGHTILALHDMLQGAFGTYQYLTTGRYRADGPKISVQLKMCLRQLAYVRAILSTA